MDDKHGTLGIPIQLMPAIALLDTPDIVLRTPHVFVTHSFAALRKDPLHGLVNPDRAPRPRNNTPPRP